MVLTCLLEILAPTCDNRDAYIRYIEDIKKI